ncbi:Phosphatidate phosphatase PAH1 [Vitis vinifera]|uniref:phosphatidate phosphatase n=1 Tax=Vitis vinifera TaxID=29760 RepID=A0A438IQ42_VITVI|nr:Phosphatidate phosphatase PAH1 [Vitis vinifera]
MNVVGIVGSLISQGVYSVATPFHPFGGAVDVIVVQQQDGTFRTTPWYVRFGKFQGVLKGAEKMVRISVNGVEAKFHMYLDNSGEAYFIREVSSEGKGTNGIIKESDGLEVIDDSSKDNGDNVTVNTCKLESSVSDPGVVQIRDECASSGGWLERVESDNDRRSFWGITGFGFRSGVVSLGPGEGTDFCEGNEEFSAGEGPWAAGYLNELDSASANVDSQNVCSVNNDNSAFGHQLEVCEGEKEKASLADRTQDVATQGRGPSMQSNLEDKNISIERKDVFRSCLELTELATQVVNGDIRHLNSSLKVQEGMENSQEKSPQGLRAVDDTEHGHVVQFSNDDELSSCNPESPWNTTSPDLCVEVEPNEKNELSMEHIELDNMSVPSVRNDPEWKDEQFGMLAVEGTNGSPQRPAPEDACSKSETVETQATISCEGIQTDSSIRFEISLCGKELRAGMGLVAAAEAFEAQRISEEEFKTSAPSIIKNENLIIRFREKYLTWDKAAHIVLGMAAFGLDLPVEPKDAIPVEQDETPKARGGDSKIAATSSGRRWRLWPIPFRRVKTLQHTDSNSSSEDVFVDSESGSQSTHVEPIPPSPGGSETPKKQLGRTNIPTTEQIASLNLKEGQNMVTFSFSTRVLGTQQVDAHIYLWKWNARIVISDVDGTITK